MQYAIVDIETTGGFPQQHGITEIAIVLHNGKEIEGKFETLVNPHQPIPPFIANMTGISDAMVAVAPSFEEVAPRIFSLLKDRVFVAHNVNFDFAFVKYHLLQSGFTLQTPKLCTIRLSRKVFPGFRKYGLGHLCRELDITIENRHRAGGDALATTKVLDLVLRNNGFLLVKEMLKKENRNQTLPSNLPEDQVKLLPDQPGVYYFHDVKGKVIYVGKAKNLKKRVVSHFTGLDTSEKRQEFLRKIHTITHTVCPTEFIASLLESVEIKRLWPIHNKSQKRYEQLWGIYLFEDNRGYLRLAIDKKRKYSSPVASFAMLADAHRFLWKMVNEYRLHPVLCFLDTTVAKELPEPLTYNVQVQQALGWIADQKETYVIRDREGCVLIEQGKFYGMGSLSTDHTDLSLDTLKERLIEYPENEVIRSMIRNFAERYPGKVVRIA
ncbi:exonuclease domain-containing protein [Sediminibacterium soli]|uniref:exonuclease domain-containing protein n=1 Tax=Sediminibacterium soli TaxID=2698829 RepID=UPI001379CD2C|nr:exonuclease domain-containing protein [Sediminibacterium soli]NCI46622.1 GIY-YIG nuclease family protein [Sediminibacterium soli]